MRRVACPDELVPVTGFDALCIPPRAVPMLVPEAGAEVGSKAFCDCSHSARMKPHLPETGLLGVSVIVWEASADEKGAE